ncbi:hypothetical protein OG535_22700 [Kitasatospora sp. NBC_00085]|uniref:hypothetical protein n=1 Tax=Kitasatospora sp. NBC_00085 TaxID=2903566 RepID=UPI003244D6A8
MTTEDIGLIHLGLLGGTLLTGALGAPPAEAHGGGLGTLAGLLGAAVLGAGLLLALIAWGGRGRHS